MGVGHALAAMAIVPASPTGRKVAGGLGVLGSLNQIDDVREPTG